MKKFKEELKQEEKLVTSEAKLEIDTKSLTKAERKRQLTKRLSDLYETQLDRVWCVLIRTVFIITVIGQTVSTVSV